MDQATAQDVQDSTQVQAGGQRDGAEPPLQHFTHEQITDMKLLTTAQIAKLVTRKPRSILNWVSSKGLHPAGQAMINKTHTFVFREQDVRDFMKAHNYDGRWTRHVMREGNGEQRAESGERAAAVVVSDDVVHAARLAGSLGESDSGEAGDGEGGDSEGEITAETLLGKGGADAYALLEAVVQQLVPVLNKKLDEKTTPFELKQHSSSVASLLERIGKLQLQVEKQAQRSGDVVSLAVAQEIVTRFCQATVSACEVLQRDLVLAIMELIAPRLDASQDAGLVRRELGVQIEAAVRSLRETVTNSVGETVKAETGGEKHAA